MQNGILIFIAVLSFAANSIITRFFQTNLQKSKHSINLYQAMFCIIAAVAYFTVSITGGVVFSWHILLPAALFGVCFAFAVLFSAKCMEMGYMSLSSVIVNLSLILPVIFSFLVMKEDITRNSVIGLALIIITLILSSLSAKGSREGNVLKWLLCVSIAFFANGGSAITQKLYKSVYGENDLMLFMGLAYSVSAAIFALVYLKNNSGENIPVSKQVKSVWMLISVSLISGLGSFAGNGLLGYLCDRVNGGILYPLINGGLSITVAITSFVFFKEKITVKKISAIIIGIIAIILLNV